MPWSWSEVSDEMPCASACYHHAFIMRGLRSPNSHDLNPVNFIWFIIQQRVYQTKVQDVNNFSQCLTDVWDGVKKMMPLHNQ